MSSLSKLPLALAIKREPRVCSGLRPPCPLTLAIMLAVYFGLQRSLSRYASASCMPHMHLYVPRHPSAHVYISTCDNSCVCLSGPCARGCVQVCTPGGLFHKHWALIHQISMSSNMMIPTQQAGH